MFQVFRIITFPLGAAHTGDSSHERAKMTRKIPKNKEKRHFQITIIVEVDLKIVSNEHKIG